MESHVKPQVGQSVWFVAYDYANEECCEGHLAAFVSHVNEDGTVNLCVLTAEGRPISHMAIPFCSHESDAPEGDFCCPIHAEGRKPAKKKKNHGKK